MTRTVNARPYSRTRREAIGRWIHADLPWACYGDHTGAAKVKFLIGRMARWCWYWRDISPGIVFALTAWTWGHSPIRLLPFPRLPFWLLVPVSAAITVWSIHYDSDHGRTANKDREGRRIKTTFQKAWLDLCRVRGRYIPIPDMKWPQVKDHVVNLNVEAVAGTSAREMLREVLDKLPAIYKKPVKIKHHGDGSYTISVFQYDPLKQEPPLPVYLGNEDGPDIRPTWRNFPLGIDSNGDTLTVCLFENNFLLPGAQRTGKSTTQAAWAIGCLAAHNVDPWGMDPQVVSLACLRGVVPFAGTIESALELLRDFHASMQKREAEMDEAGTSLATPSAKWPLRVLFIDELLRFIDPDQRDELDGNYAKTFLGILKDILSAGPKTGHVVVATTTDPRLKVLSEGVRDLFSTRLIFRCADQNASGVAGANTLGFKAHELPAVPGRAILRYGADLVQCRTWGVWDKRAVEAARNLTGGPTEHQPRPAQQADLTGIPPTEVPDISMSGQLATSSPANPGPGGTKPGYGEARGLILWSFHNYSTIQTRREIEQRTGLKPGTVKYWLTGRDCPNRIPTMRLPGHRYELAGGR